MVKILWVTTKRDDASSHLWKAANDGNEQKAFPGRPMSGALVQAIDSPQQGHMGLEEACSFPGWLLACQHCLQLGD